MRFRLLFLLFLIAECSFAQQEYNVDISSPGLPVREGQLRLGAHTGPEGDSLSANNLYFTRNGQPWFPVMGEFHYQRYPREYWEESVLKMKAAGINVIASYVFWIYHEEKEGEFDWKNDNDLRAFAQICKKNHVYLFVRIGPWAHGEVRNGGFPDWLVKNYPVRRKNDPAYLAKVHAFFRQIAVQLKGLYFRDGGPVIGCQIENEYRFNKAAGLDHILTLKKMAADAGIDVPFYTATGWPGSDLRQRDLIPVWGAYPEAPWDKRVTRLPLSGNYLFGALKNDPAIGADLFGTQDSKAESIGYSYPYATAEMGGGNQITYHRRPVITSEDVTSLAYIKTGSGANLMGYYMFHGGSNKIGKLSTLQESKATGYPNDYPIISYDFQAPVGEWGQLRQSYRDFKTLNTFLNEFGGSLAGCYPFFPEKIPSGPADTATLRFSVRAANNKGFIFISNYQRQKSMPDFRDVSLNIKLRGGDTLHFPAESITVKRNLQAIFPFNMNMEGAALKYATVQPFCRIDGTEPLYVFFAPEGVIPEYSFYPEDISDMVATCAEVIRSGSVYAIKNIRPGSNCTVEVSLRNGKKFRILTISAQQARNSWKASVFGSERLLISNCDLIFPAEGIQVTSTGSSVLQLSVYPDPSNIHTVTKAEIHKTKDGIFSVYTFILPESNPGVAFKKVDDLSAFVNRQGRVPANETNSAGPGPEYQTNLTDVESSLNYVLSLPAHTLKGLNDAFLRITYSGDTGAAYLNGKLVADDFFSGQDFTIGLRRFRREIEKQRKFVFQLQPLSAGRKIFFEENVAGNRAAQTPEVSKIVVVPQYQVLVRANR